MIRKASIFLLLTLLVAFPAMAKDDVLLISYSDSGLTFTPNVTHDYFELRVSTPDDRVLVQSESFFALSDNAAALQDGVYTWEVRMAPKADPAFLAEMQNRRGDASIDDRLAKDLIVKSGAFTIKGGALVDGNLVEVFEDREIADIAAGDTVVNGKAGGETVVTKDQVFVDDVIVQGSICAGLDCTNGESFGFDTIRLKENNLRIKAQDTSNSASFPSVDWQLAFNDTTNGGKNKFSIDDIDGGRTPFTIEASAPTNSLYVDDGGRIGLGTATPVVELHIPSGDTPTMRLEQDGTSGFTPQTWDVAGNETNFFVRDATNGSRIPFKIIPNAPTNSLYIADDGDIGLGTSSPAGPLHVTNGTGAITDDFMVDSSGNVGIGTQSPTVKLFIDGGNLSVNRSDVFNTQFFLNNTATGGFSPSWSMRASGGSGGFFITDNSIPAKDIFILDRDLANDALHMKTTGLFVNGVVVMTSDRNMKRDFAPVDPADVLAKVVEIPMTTWSYKTDETRHLGPMAQDFHAAFALGTDNRHISYTDLAGVALTAIQGLNAEVEEKDAQIEDLNARVAALEALVEKLVAE